MTDAALAVGRFIRRQRRKSGMTQAVLGRDVCVSQSYIYFIEAGKHVPRADVRRRLCASLDLSTADVARLDDLVAAAAPLRRDSPEYRALIKKNGFQPGHQPAHRFEKGNVPWNKGLKGIHLSPQSEFKRGGLHGAAARKLKPVGTVTIRRDKTRRKRRWIKVRPRGCGVDAYIPLARYVYEQQHGPIPRGTFVVHADGDTLNDDGTNLILMDRQHLFAWQRRIRPGMEDKRKQRLSASLRERWADYRAIKARPRPNELTCPNPQSSIVNRQSLLPAQVQP